MRWAHLKKSVNLELEGVIIKEIMAETCDRCGEKYFDTKTATFIQDITNFIKNKKTELTPTMR